MFYKLCIFEDSSKKELLNHYRVKHCTFGRGCSVSCLHLSCHCSFKTWGGLRSYLFRAHNSQETEECEGLQSFRCKICDSFYPSTNYFFQIYFYSWKDFKTDVVAKIPVVTENEIEFPVLELHQQIVLLPAFQYVAVVLDDHKVIITDFISA